VGSLRDAVLLRETVKYAGGDFTVGPLTGADILGLFVGHRQAIEALYESYGAGKDADSLFIDMAVTFPQIVAEIIARASGDFDEVTLAKARGLDFGTWLAALEKIGALTVQSVGGLGNLAILVERLAGSFKGSMAQGGSPLPNGSTTSENSVRS